MKRLRYSLLAGRYAICKLEPQAAIPDWTLQGSEFYSITRTADELSIVVPEAQVPLAVSASPGWVCLRLVGPFAFSETGVLSSFVKPLAEQEIGIFAIATYDTDYVLIEEKFWARASEALSAAGHELVVRSP